MRKFYRANKRFIITASCFVSGAFFLPSASAQQSSSQSISLFTSPVIAQAAPLIAQAASATPPGSFGNPTVLPTDVTPLINSAQRGMLNRDRQFQFLRALPDRLWFSNLTEVSNRLETNVFLTHGRHRGDYVMRTTQNLTIGYNLLKNTAVYGNYFVIKDVFAKHSSLTRPTTQSVSVGLRQMVPLSERTNLQLDFQARELWAARHVRYGDLLPSINITHIVTPHVVLFGSTLLQIRSKEYFQASRTIEMDPFYSAGFIYRHGLWTFSASHTYVTNFRTPHFHGNATHHGNVVMISDFEINRPVSCRAPGLVAFVRAEPVWSWHGAKLPGLDGFDFRLFGGVRFAFSKQPYNANIDKLRKQLIESEKIEGGKTTHLGNGR